MALLATLTWGASKVLGVGCVTAKAMVLKTVRLAPGQSMSPVSRPRGGLRRCCLCAQRREQAEKKSETTTEASDFDF